MNIVFDNPHAYRGVFIGQFAELELAISSFLSLYFIPSGDNNDLSSILIDRLTFESKRTAYKTVLDKIALKNGFIKAKNNKYPYSELLDEIRKLNEIRIQFAHYYLADADMDKGHVIKLIEFRNSGAIWVYSQEKFDSVFERLFQATRDVFKSYDVLLLNKKST